MTTRTARAETIARAVKLHGSGPKAVGVISRVLKVDEADATKMAKELHEAGSGPSAATSTSAAQADAARAWFDTTWRQRTDQLAHDAVAAVARPITKASAQDLETIAAAQFGAAVFGR